jgi:hypothetical protein
MRPLTIITIVLYFASQVFAYAIKNAQPGWMTKSVSMFDGSTRTLYIRDTFVHTEGIEARNHSVSAKFRFQGGTVQRSCESESFSRAPWITSAEAQKCADLGIQILGQPGYWEGWNWPGGSSTYSLARLADCEFGIARVDGLDSQAMSVLPRCAAIFSTENFRASYHLFAYFVSHGNTGLAISTWDTSSATFQMRRTASSPQTAASRRAARCFALGRPCPLRSAKRLGPWPMWRVSEE